jgi:hypothetical protein
MAAHFDQILGDPESSFYLACAPRVHMVLGEDYRDHAGHFRAGTTRSYQAHGEVFMREVAEALKTLPRIFLDLVLPGCPAWPRGSRTTPTTSSPASWSSTRSPRR